MAEEVIAEASEMHREVLQTIRTGGFREIAGRVRTFAADLADQLPCGATLFPGSVWDDLRRIAKVSSGRMEFGKSCSSSGMLQRRSMSLNSMFW